MLTRLNQLSNSTLYWWLVFSITLTGIVIALTYQYALNEEPCVLCIHIRIGFFAILLTSFVALLIPRKRLTNLLFHLVNSAAIFGLFWKCRELLGVERGTIESSCMINAGLPEWFALESWLPAIFEVRGLCGQSPELLFGITMAEALYASSAFACIVTVIMILASLIGATEPRPTQITK